MLSARYKAAPGESISIMMEKHRHLDLTVKRNWGKVYKPEGLSGWLLKKIGDLDNIGEILTNNELVTYFKESRILKTYPFKTEITHRTVNPEFLLWRKSGSVDGGFRYTFLLYMRNVGKHLNIDVDTKKWGYADTYGHKLNASANNPCAPDLASMFSNDGAWNRGNFKCSVCGDHWKQRVANCAGRIEEPLHLYKTWGEWAPRWHSVVNLGYLQKGKTTRSISNFPIWVVIMQISS